MTKIVTKNFDAFVLVHILSIKGRTIETITKEITKGNIILRIYFKNKKKAIATAKKVNSQ